MVRHSSVCRICDLFYSRIAETHRTPFDIPEADGELVAGYHSEYSGMKFGMFFVGEYMGVTLISALIATLFFGGWLGPSFLPPAFWFFFKTAFFICMFILIRASLPRPRYDQLMELGWKVLLPLVLLNILITGAVLFMHIHNNRSDNLIMNQKTNRTNDKHTKKYMVHISSCFS